MALNVFEVFAKINLDNEEYKRGISESKGLLSGFGDAAQKAFGVLSGAAVVGTTAAIGGISALTKSAVSSYGEYEQLAGGAQKIFDEMDFAQIAEDANKAYKDLNMSASDYLASINLAGATFASTMGDQKGYDTARTGMKAIADYASGTGKNLNELNQKYQLITKSASSYQSIADQFAGILPQTSADFLEQAQQAGFLSDEYTKLTEVPVAEYQEAVTKMLEKGVDALGLLNNTAVESEGTLTGSFAMAKSAWSNLVTALADDQADLDTRIDDFVNSLNAAIDNVLPLISRALQGTGQLMTKLLPKMFAMVPGFLEKNLPDFLNTVDTIFGQTFPELARVLVKSLPQLIKTTVSVGKTIATSLYTAFSENISEEDLKTVSKFFTEKIPDFINTKMEEIDFSKVSEFFSKAIVKGLNGLSKFIENVDWKEVGNSISEFLNGIDWDSILTSLFTLIGNIIKNTPDLIKGVVKNIDAEAAAGIVGFAFANKLVGKISSTLSDDSSLGSKFTSIRGTLGQKIGKDADGNGVGYGQAFVAGIESFLVGWSIGTLVYNHFKEEIDSVLHPFFESVEIGWKSIKSTFSDWTNWWADRWQDVSDFKDSLEKTGEEWYDNWDTGWTDIKNTMNDWAGWWSDRGQDVKNAFEDAFTESTYKAKEMPDVMKGIGAQALREYGIGVDSEKPAVKNQFDSIKNDVKDRLNVANESRVWGNDLVIEYNNGLQIAGYTLSSTAHQLTQGIRDIFNGIQSYSWGSDLITGFVNGINGQSGLLTDTLASVGQGIRDFLHFTQPDKGPLSGPNGFETYGPDMMKTFAEGIENNRDLVEDQVADLMSNVDSSLNTPDYSGGEQTKGRTDGNRTITLVLTTNAGEVIAKTTAPEADVINSERMSMAGRYLAYD